MNKFAFLFGSGDSPGVDLSLIQQIRSLGQSLHRLWNFHMFVATAEICFFFSFKSSQITIMEKAFYWLLSTEKDELDNLLTLQTF